MRFLRVLIVTVPLWCACKEQGSPAGGAQMTREAQSGGYNPENDSRAHAGLPSQTPPSLPKLAAPSLDDLGLAREAQPAPPPPQEDLPAPKGKAGGTLQ